ncbi:MAG: hypothetical protein EXS10_00820 [Phycisphaerales bacterium]|nr:hypothetical protein [Phycisphaerales bacterium]
MTATLAQLTTTRIDAARALLKAARMQDAILTRLERAEADSPEAEVATEELAHLVGERANCVDSLAVGQASWTNCIAQASRAELENARAFAQEVELILKEIQSIDERTASLLVARRIEVSEALRKSGNAALALRAYGPTGATASTAIPQFTDTQG